MPEKQPNGSAKRPQMINEPTIFPPQHQQRPGTESKLKPQPHYEAPLYRPAGKLKGKVALITGADSGIGRAVAVIYAREGAKVAVNYLHSDGDARDTQTAVEQAGGQCLLIKGDVGDPAFCETAVAKTLETFGKIDILVNNAAVQASQDSLLDLTDEQIDTTFRTNILGYIYMARAVLPYLKPGAAIIMTGSITGIQGSPKLLDYSATKGAIHAFTKSLAQNLVDKGIRVNAIAPGPVWTPLNPSDNKTPKEVSEFGSDTPYGRPAQPEELAPSYVFLASDPDSSYITGEVLTLLGGETTGA